MQKPISGSVVINCETPDCPSQFAGDFVYDMTAWKENFPTQKLTCKICKKTYDYSRDKIIQIPTLAPKEKATDDTEEL
jgi:hypothetical protein